MNYRDRDRLELIVSLIGDIERRTVRLSKTEFLADRDEVDLTAYRLSIIGESCGRLSPDIRGRHPTVDWPAMQAMRNVIAHDYRGIDPELVWAVLGKHLALLAGICEAELQAG